MYKNLLVEFHTQMETITTLSKKKAFEKSQYVKNLQENFQTILSQLEARTNDRMIINHQLDQITTRNTLFLIEAVGKKNWMKLYFLFHQAEGYCKALHAHHFKRH